MPLPELKARLAAKLREEELAQWNERQREIDELNAEIAALHSKTIDIKVNVSGGAVNFQNPSNQSLPGGYPGGTGAAGGTVIPGYAPGHDTVSMHLSPGEAVLVPELTRAIGPDNIMAMNRVFSGGRRSAMGHMAGGGIAGVSSTLGGSGGADEFNIFVSLLGGSGGYSTTDKGTDCAVSVDRASEVRRVIPEHSERAAVNAGERGDHAGTEPGAELEHRILVEQRVEDPAHVVDPLAVLRDERPQ